MFAVVSHPAVLQALVDGALGGKGIRFGHGSIALATASGSGIIRVDPVRWKGPSLPRAPRRS